MKLSVIVPVYNMAGEGKLDFCLNSLLNQTISDYEIIAVDDASTDNSLDVLREYEQRHPDKLRVVVHEVNKRQGGAKNTGLKIATGEWIGFVDSDDWVSPDCYEKLLKKAQETGADFVGCDYNLVDEHTFQVGKVVQNNSADQTGILDREKHGKLLMRPGSMVIKIYRHNVIRENQLSFPEGIFYEDNCAAPVWSLYFTHFERVEEPLYYYYQHNTSTVHLVTEEKCRNRMRAAIMMLSELKKRDVLKDYYAEVEYRFAELYYVITLFSYMLGMKHKKLKFIKELKNGILTEFPGFQQNKYYLQYTNEEEKQMISLQMKSDAKFFYFYNFKLAVRRFRKKLHI